MTIQDIIARLEAAKGPDREIDEALFELAHGRKRRVSTFEQYDPSEKLPHYTSSVDAALTLVPAHHLWQLKHGIGCEAVVWHIEVDYDDAHEVPTGSHMDIPAIALCIASLRAIASLKARIA